MYIDSYALIAQQDGDVGDSLQREGMYAFGRWMRYDDRTQTVYLSEPPGRRDPKKIIAKFEVAPGVYVRHPDPTRWSSDPDTTSRDQVVPVIAYCAAFRDYPRLARLFGASAARGLFAQNTLPINEGPEHRKVPDTMIGTLGLFIRAGGWWTAPLYPLLFITDTADLIATVLATIPLHWEESTHRLRISEPRDVDDNNSVIAHLLALRFKPTPVSWLNRQIYAATRGRNLGNSQLGETNAVMGALAWYHRREAGGNPEIAELYRPLIERYFSPREAVTEQFYELAAAYYRLLDNRTSTIASNQRN